MAMAPEAGQNILGGNSGSHSPSPKPHWPRWPLCRLDSGSRGGTWGLGLPAFLLSAAPRGARESVEPPLKAKGRGAAGMEGPSSPRWSLAGGPGAGYPPGHDCGSRLPASPLLASSTEDWGLSTATSAITRLAFLSF